MNSQAGDIESPIADDIAGANFMYPLPAQNPPDPSSDSPQDIPREGVSADIGTWGGNKDRGGGGGGGGGGGCFIVVVKGN